MAFNDIHNKITNKIFLSFPADQAIRRHWSTVTWRFVSILLGVFFLFFSTIGPFTPHVCLSASEGKRLPAVASAQNSASGYDPKLAVDENESTLWVANLTPQASNNRVWFQLDLGGVKQVARLHWHSASGSPYPASVPNKYQVLVSADGSKWITAYDASMEGGNEQKGNLLLNTDARYVRLLTTQVNDGSGWALGLREIWVTEGRDNSAAWRIQAAMSDGRIGITWQIPNDLRTKRLRVYRATTPTEVHGKLVATLDASAHEFSDSVPNWTPYYYWVQASDAKGGVLGTSTKAAAFAHPAKSASARDETFAFWYEPYKPSADPDGSLRHIGNAAFVIGADPSAITDLAKTGMGVLPYITLYQTFTWAGSFPKEANVTAVGEKIAPIAFYQPSARFPGSPPGFVPSVFFRPGNIKHSPQSIQYATCPNSSAFRDMVLAKVHKELANGSFGFFVDNGYEDDIAASSVCQSTGHAHYYGANLTSADAFLGMLMEIICAVKKQNPRGIVMVNAGVPVSSQYYGLRLGDVSDCRLWESYLRSSFSTQKEHVHNWESVYRRSIDLEREWQATPTRRTYVLSFPWDRTEAFFCYATAKLCHLPWSAGLGINDPAHAQFGGHFGTYPELVNLRLGAPLVVNQYGGEKIGSVYVRRYELGFVAVNPTLKSHIFLLKLGKHTGFRDVFADKAYSGDTVSLELPPESGRVYLYQ